jgi:hypothetical protein
MCPDTQFIAFRAKALEHGFDFFRSGVHFMSPQLRRRAEICSGWIHTEYIEAPARVEKPG